MCVVAVNIKNQEILFASLEVIEDEKAHGSHKKMLKKKLFNRFG